MRDDTRRGFGKPDRYGETGVRPAGLTLRFMQSIPLMIEASTVW